ncbi:MAG: GNAT family N-acetyltransferase [Phycisphaerales bacterium]|nr:GNAT family N-acetyltransferase [Phycisphaerales bacterium]
MTPPATSPHACTAGPAHAVEVPPPLLADAPLRLRPLDPLDRAEYLRLVRATRADLDRWCPLHRRGESDEQMFERQLELARAGEASGHARRRIAESPDGRIVGGFNLNAIVRGLEFEADANWWIGAQFTGLGLATRGVRALIRHAFDDLPAGLGLHRIHAGIARENLASRRVADKAGFTQRPGLRSYLNVNGEWQALDAWTADISTWRA